MELIGHFDVKFWENGNAETEDKSDYVLYRIMKVKSLNELGYWEYCAFDDDGTLRKLKIDGGNSETRDPLQGIGLVHLKTSLEERITGIIVEDDCVKRIDFMNRHKSNTGGIKEQQGIST